MLLSLLLFVLPLISSKSISIPSESSCSFEKGDYSLSWYYDDLSSDVVFKLSAKSSLSNFWTGVLLGDETKPTDAIGVFVRSGQIGLTDAHVSEDGILADNLTDVQSLSFDLTEDKLTAEFARPLTPQDKTDADLAHCVTFFFPIQPAEIKMGEAIEIPQQMESKRICDLVDSCLQRDQTAVVKREEKAVCEYKKDKETSVSWHLENGHYVFVFDHAVKKGKWWSSIGAGESMQEMSMAVAFEDNGKVKTVGGFTSTDYKLPEKDDNNSHKVKLITSNVKNGKAHFEFSVNEDFINEKTIDGCVTLQIAVNSGQFGANNKIQKHQTLPTAVPVCDIEQCSKEKKTTKNPKTAVEHQEPPVSENQLNRDGNEEQSVVDVQPDIPKESIIDSKPDSAAESIVDARPGIPAESIVDLHDTKEPTGPPSNPQLQGDAPGSVVDVQTPQQIPAESVVDVHSIQPAESIVDVNQPGQVPKHTIVDVKALPPNKHGHTVNANVAQNETGEFNNDQGASGKLVDVRPPENTNETIVDFREVTQKPEDLEHIVDFQEKREDDTQLTNGTAQVDGNLEEIVKGKGKTTKKPKKMSSKPKGTKKPEAVPSESIVDFREEPALEGSGELFEGSGENATNETSVGENADQGENSVLTDLDASNETSHSRPPIVNVDGAVDPKRTTFTPPVTVPQLHVGDAPASTLAVASNQPAAAAPSENTLATVANFNSTATSLQQTTPSNVALVPKVCANPTDLRICDGYFADYLGKVQEWSFKHKHTVEQSMWKACRLLSQVKHVPSMCCNRYKKECDPYSRQYLA